MCTQKQFRRYNDVYEIFTRAKTKCKKVIFEAEKCTQELYKNSNLDVEIITPEDIANINYDLHTLNELTLLAKRTNRTRTSSTRKKYLIADKEKNRILQRKIF